MDGVKERIHSQFAVNLIGQLEGGKITHDDFMRECAYWAVREGFDDLKPLPLPTKPQEVFDFEQLPEYTREKLNNKYYDDHPVINSFYQQIRFVKDRNKTNFEWLREILEYIPQEDIPTRQKIENRIQDFIVGSDLPEGVKHMAAIFGGKVID